MRRLLIGAAATAGIAFTLGAMVTRTHAQELAPPDHVTPRFQQVQAELAAEAAEDLRDARAREGTESRLPNPYTPPKPKTLSLEERQVRALERIARALESRCGSGGQASAP